MARIQRRTIKQIVLLVVMYLLFFLFLFVTDPNKLPVGWLLVPFVWLFATLFVTVLYLQGRKLGKKRQYSAKTLGTAGVIAAIPTFVLLLDSINQLTIRDVLIFFVFSILTLFYVRKISFKQNT